VSASTPVTPADARAGAIVVLPDGREGRLVYAPPLRDRRPGDSVPHVGRGHSARQKGRAVVLVGGRRYRCDPNELTKAPQAQEGTTR